MHIRKYHSDVPIVIIDVPIIVRTLQMSLPGHVDIMYS